MKAATAVIVPNWNGKETLGKCLDSLLAQIQKAHIIVVENGSTDGSLEFLQAKYPQVEVVALDQNLGFAGGVNVGIRQAMKEGAEFVALFNNDATADKHWLEKLVDRLEHEDNIGIATCKLLDESEKNIDSTGDMYTIWGLPFPRGRDETASDKYDDQTSIFSASGGASLYRAKLFDEIGLFDEDFFAYYEDVDISFRAQLAGWKVAYVPDSKAFHQHGTTSSKIKGFTTYQTLKNLPWLLWKNVPGKLLWTIKPRFALAYFGLYVSAIQRGQGWAATDGTWQALVHLPKKLGERRQIQANRKVSVEYIYSMLTHDLPPNAIKLRNLRTKWWKLRGKKT